MGSSKGRRGSGVSLDNSPHRLEQHEAEGGWRGRVKVLASSSFGAAATKERGGRAVALTEEDFRKSGFRARELVAVLAGPTRLVAGRVFPLPTAALRPGGVGLSSASAQSLLGADGENVSGIGGGGGGARVRVRRLGDTSVAVLEATSLSLVLEAGVGTTGGRGGGGGLPTTQSSSPHAYLKGLARGRKALLLRAVGYCSRGSHAREGDVFSVSFEGIPHVFRVKKLEPPAPLPCDRQHALKTTRSAPAAERTGGINGDGGDSLVMPLGKLSISEASIASEPSRSKAVGSSAAVAPAPEGSEDGEGKNTRTAEATNAVDVGAEKPAHNRASGQEAVPTAARARLEAFYREHNPGKLNGGDIDGIIAKYAGREDTLFAKLEKKYGAGSSVLRTAAAGGNTGTERQQQQQQKQNQPASLAAMTDRATAPATHSPFPGRRTPSDHGLEKSPAGELPFPATPSARQQGGESLSCSSALGGDDAAGIRSWGANETLWIVGADTLIQVSGADAPPEVDDGRVIPSPPAETSRTDLKFSGALEGGFGGDTPQTRGEAGGGGGTECSPQAGGEGGCWSSVGGLSSQIEQLREAIELPLRSPEVLRRYGVRPPRGVLLHGPPGTGKTTLARAAAKACGCHVIVVNGSELMSRFVGESEGALRKTFAEASRRAPCLIVFDEVDTLCPRRDQASSEAQRRVVSTILALLDGVDAQERVVVIACTNRPQALDPALRRPGRLDSEVEVGVPNAAGRAEILRVLLRGVPHAMTGGIAATASNTPSGGGDGCSDGGGIESSSSDRKGGVEDLAARTHGFVGADLQLLVKEAALLALRRTRGSGVSGGGWGYSGGGGPDGGGGERQEEAGGRINDGRGDGGDAKTRIGRSKERKPGTAGGGLPTLTPEDFRAALPLVSPSGLREVAVEVPSVKWDDIGGMEGVKQSLREVVEWPLRHPEAFSRMGMSPPRGVLLYGPPGCSKTLMARALATESGMNFLAVKGPELLSKWLGESERAMQALFKRARAAAPTIIFFDEVDALACKRGGGGEGGAGATERVLTQLLTELDGIQPVKRLVVVAATNRPDVIDPALLRPGRLDRLVYVPPPDSASRREILRLSLAKVPCGGDVDREVLARRTEGFSGAEVVALCREASICALEKDRSATQVRQAHLLEALGHIRPQITPSALASYASFQGWGR